MFLMALFYFSLRTCYNSLIVKCKRKSPTHGENMQTPLVEAGIEPPTQEVGGTVSHKSENTTDMFVNI